MSAEARTVSTAPAVAPEEPAARAGLPLLLRLAPLLAALVVVPLAVTGPLVDPDTWWHLRSGSDVLSTHVLVGPDPWSPLTSGTWVRHQWLAEAAMSGMWALGGAAAVAWLVPVAAVATVLSTHLTLRRDSGVVVSAIVALLGFVGTTVSLSARPQVLSFPLAVVAAGAWLASSRDARLRWWLVPLTWVWACVHGFWILVPLLGALVALGVLLEERRAAPALRLGALAAATAVAGALTPVGPRLLEAPFAVGEITGFIEEWQPAPAGSPAFLVVAAMVLLALGLRLRSGRAPWPEVLLAAFAAYLAVTHGRTVALAAMVAAPLLGSALSTATRTAERVRRRELGALALAAVVGVGVAGALAPVRAQQPDGFPHALSAELATLSPGTVVCNDYFVGGWLLWQHPDLVPVVDGRTELYSVGSLRQFVTLEGARPGYEAVLAERGCPVALVDGSGPLAAALSVQGWQRAGTDGRWVLLERP